MATDGSLAVRRWFDQQAQSQLCLTAPVLAEVLAGIAMLPAGRRQSTLATAFHQLVQERFGHGVLAFDEPAASAYAILVAEARKAGRTIAPFDGQIAAIAKVHGHIVATRDTAPFLAAGVLVINPWRPVSSPN